MKWCWASYSPYSEGPSSKLDHRIRCGGLMSPFILPVQWHASKFKQATTTSFLSPNIAVYSLELLFRIGAGRSISVMELPWVSSDAHLSIEGSGWVVSALGRCQVPKLSRNNAVLKEAVPGFPQFLQPNTGIVHENKTWSLPFISLLFSHSQTHNLTLCLSHRYIGITIDSAYLNNNYL
jgi:hypothetical protein